MNDPFVTQLAELCRAERTRAKWVIVPARAIGLTLGDRLAREGTDWANLRFVTPLDLAIPMAAPFLIERGIEPSEEHLGPPLMMRLLLGLPETHAHFRPMAVHMSMADALWQTVRELRYAGVGAADLAAKPFTAAPGKQAELAALLAAYEQHLETSHLADMPLALEEATQHPDWCPIAPSDIVIELPDTLWSPLVRRFLDTLPGQRVPARALTLPEAAMPGRAKALAAPTVRVDVPATTAAARLRYLQSPQTAGKLRDDGTLDLFHAGGADAEVDEVFRRILASGLPLDQVEVACASDSYSQLVREKATLLDWGVTLASGVPATMTRPGLLLLRFCDWVESDFAAADLRRLLQSGDCAPRAFDETDAGPSPGQAAKLLAKAEATWGRGAYALALKRLAEQYAHRAADPEATSDEREWNERKAAHTATLSKWIGEVISSVPEPSAPGEVPLEALVECASKFLEANAARASAIDAMAHVAVISALADLKTMGGYHCGLATGLRFLRGRAASLSVGRDRPRPGRLHVSPLNEAGFDGRRLVFIAGLQEGGVFPAAIEDPVLLDDERVAISPLLRASADRQDEAVFAALSRIAAIGASADRVCLSFSCRDTRDFRETHPSWIVLQAFRLMKGNPALDYGDLADWLGEPASAVPRATAGAMSDAGWWLAQARSAPAGARAAILRAWPALANGIRAEAARASDTFTEFDGLVPAAGPILDPSRTSRSISATTLEHAAACPLRFFLEHGLGVKAIEEGTPEDDRWLDPATRGTELHALFARIMRLVIEEKRKPDLAADRKRLRSWGQQRLDDLRAEMPPPSEEVFAREAADFLADLDAFIEAECDGRHGKSPIGFEVAFGFKLEGDEEEKLASADPVIVSLGGGRKIALHGRIDRVNHTAPGEYEVADYKTGGFWRDDWQGSFAGGTRLQHALYGVAAAEILRSIDPKAKVVRGVYLFPAVKGFGRRYAITAPSRTTLIEVLRDLLDVLGGGAFLPAETARGCRWCDFKAACHAEVDGEDKEGGPAKAKLDAAASPALAALRRLRSHS